MEFSSFISAIGSAMTYLVTNQPGNFISGRSRLEEEAKTHVRQPEYKHLIFLFINFRGRERREIVSECFFLISQMHISPAAFFALVEAHLTSVCLNEKINICS